MKKLFLIIGLAAMSVSAFAQGNWIFQTSASAVWDGWSAGNGTFKRSASNNVAFYWSSNLGATPAVATATGIAGTPTNSTPSFNVDAAWTAILSDPNFTLGVDNTTTLPAVTPTSTVGTASYLGGAVFQVAGSASAGGTAKVFLVAWNRAYATPAAAAAAHAELGWSAPFNYTYAAGPNPGPAGTPGNMIGLYTPFGVDMVPEPSTFALAGLGAAAMLIFRRRK